MITFFILILLNTVSKIGYVRLAMYTELFTLMNIHKRYSVCNTCKTKKVMYIKLYWKAFDFTVEYNSIQTFCSIRTCLIVFYMPIRFSTWLISKYCLKINKWKKYKARVFSNKVKTKQIYLLRLNLDSLARSDPINCFTFNNYNVKNLILQYGWESFRLQSSSLRFIRK